MALLLSACQASTADDQPPGTAKPDPTAAILSGEACPDVGEKAYFFWMEPRSAEPGEQIALHPYWTDNPGAYNDLPPGCLGDLEVTPEDAVAFSRDETGLATATISETIEPGTRLMLEGRYAGRYGISGPVDVFIRAANPLVGIWRQDGSDCPPESAVRELVFSGAGVMSVTWTPFETYKDYWADYTFDPASGAFSFDVDGGNQIPEDIISEGAARIEGDRLILDGVFLGTPRQAMGECDGDFVR